MRSLVERLAVFMASRKLMRNLGGRLPQSLQQKVFGKSRLAITGARAAWLAVMLDRPTRYRQRCLEQVSFLPAGGQQWVRTLQTQIPKNAEPKSNEWRLVSLGEFQRWRLPDFTITDANGTRLNRLTRRQHGIALTKALLVLHFFSLPNGLRPQFKQGSTKQSYGRLRDELYDFFTSVKEIRDTERAITDLNDLFIRLLLQAGFPVGSLEQEIDLIKRVDDFAYDLASNLKVLQYLCWVKAKPGEILNLRVLWTMRDTLSSLISRGRLRPALIAFRDGILTLDATKRRKVWMKWYCQFGLAPLSYEFRSPKTGSYYFTIEPPPKTDVTYLDWEASNSIEDDELNSGFASAHLHDRNATSHRTKDYAVRAYVRCRTREHKQIAAGALLNAIFVFFVARGKFTTSIGASAQTWLLLTPTIFIAYLAEQQRHYYAHTTRRQRGILWVYLAISVVFLVAVSFSLVHGATDSRHWDGFTRWVAWIFATSSIAICMWYAPLGYNYQLTTDKWMRKRLAGENKKSLLCTVKKRNLPIIDPSLPDWEIYGDVIRKYCNRVLIIGVPTIIIAMTVLVYTWHYPQKHKPPTNRTATVTHVTGTISGTVGSGIRCKMCEVNLRFTPASN